MTKSTKLTEISESNDQLSALRAKRFDDAVHLRQPDAIPVIVPFSNLLSELEGCTKRELYDDPDYGQAALERAAVALQPDGAQGMFLTPAISKTLGDQMTKWPGYGLDDNESYQFHEQEFMKVEDYSAFFKDQSDFALRKYLPRAFKGLEGLAMLPPTALTLMGTYSMIQNLIVLTLPPVASAFRTLLEAADAHTQWVGKQIEYAGRMQKLGFPNIDFYGGGVVFPPFDFVSNTLRGMKGIFTDIRKYPEKLLEAEERVIDFQVEHAVLTARIRNLPYALIPTHRGSDGFMSLQNFERFYWPQLKKLILQLIENGITPFVSYEGVWDQRLKYLQELPKGKTIGQFQNTDVFKVKEMIGETMCIVGGMPVSLLWGGTLTEIDEHTKRVCKEIGRNGGFVMFPSIGELQGCKWNLIKAWVDATRKYGLY